jgi:hypothetical protein
MKENELSGVGTSAKGKGKPIRVTPIFVSQPTNISGAVPVSPGPPIFVDEATSPTNIGPTYIRQ